MIKTWKLARFKSVVQETTLELAPLTVFSGANSSGKSSIIQSILMTAQSLQSAVQSRPVVLNGHMARLGAFDDIVSDTGRQKSILVGFSIEMKPQTPGSLTTRSPRPGAFIYYRQGEPKLIECSYRFSASGPAEERDILQLQPRLEATNLKVQSYSHDEPLIEEIRILASKDPIEKRAAQLKLGPSADVGELAGLRYKIKKLAGRTPDEETYASAERAGVTLLHFLPSATAVVYDVVETEARRFVESLVNHNRYSIRQIESRSRFFDYAEVQLILRQVVQKTVEETLEARRPTSRVDFLIESTQGDLTPEVWSKLTASMNLSARALFQRNLSDRAGEIRAAIRKHQPSRKGIAYTALPDTLEESVFSLSQYFSHSLKYLGPLRDDPKPIYPLAGSADPTDVGLRGEHTAAVLDIHRQTQVSYISSKTFIDSALEPEEAQTTLLSAVLDWLGYMGVGHNVTTLDRGKLGHELKISTASGTTLHDLTQVGVGVSQVLPILVLSLLAEPNSTLIFEQPELHLHPRVQTRLADFFVSMTQLGKQCIVESHSEYLINRLRYRAAVSKDKKISDSVILYFVEKEENQSRYRPIRINEYGVIEDWPKGFFDENEENAAAILKAGMEKRRQFRR